MNQTQKDVLLFQQTFNPSVLPKPFKPTFVTGEVWELCMNLIEEEWEELADARTVEERADAFADLHYVLHFAENCSGLDMEPFFNEVQRSNMTKAWTKAEVESAAFDSSFMTMTYINQPEGRCWVVKNDFGKVVKSPSYSKANLKPILEAQLNGN